MTPIKRSQITGARRVLMPLSFFEGYRQMLNIAAAPLYAASFSATEAQLAATFGGIALGTVGTAATARLAELVGPRRVIVAATITFGLLCIATASVPNLVGLALTQSALALSGGTILALGTILTVEPTSNVTNRYPSPGAIYAYIGSGTALLCAAAFTQVEGTWRWTWLLGALAILLVPRIYSLPEIRHSPEAPPIKDHTLWRRAVCVLATYALGNVGVTAGMTWLIYHAVVHRQLSFIDATLAVVVGGAIGLLGFPVGAAAANAFGRLRTTAISGLVFSIAITAYYRLTAETYFGLIVCLASAFGLASAGFCSFTVAMRTAMTDLFPESSRPSVQGMVVVVAASASVVAQFATAGLIGLLSSLEGALTILCGVASVGFVLPWVLLEDATNTTTSS